MNGAVQIVRSSTAAMALTGEHALTVRRIVDAVLPGAEVFVFGSRATGKARPFSDLDLLFVKPPQIGWDELAQLRDQFDASTLPFRVDVVEAAGLAPGMVERVTRERKPLP